jgi:hypothetical protein
MRVAALESGFRRNERTIGALSLFAKVAPAP